MTSLTVIERAIYRGPHLWSLLPMLRVRVDLAGLASTPTSALAGFNARLLALLPGLAGHGCSLGVAGGLVRRMEAGTRLGHVAEHVALELQTLAGTPVARGKTRSVAGHPGWYDILFAYADETAARLAGRAALALVAHLAGAGFAGLGRVHETPVGEGGDVAGALAAIAAAAAGARLGPSTAAIVAEARRRRVPVTRLDDRSLLRLGWGARQRTMRATVSGTTPHLAVALAADKHATRLALAAAGVPVPAGIVAADVAEAEAFAAAHPGGVVVKPRAANHGRGVGVAPTDLAAAWSAARAHGPGVVVEERLAGEDHRILVVGGRVVAAARRAPAAVTGDGRATIAQLIAAANADPARAPGHAGALTRLPLDALTRAHLAAGGLGEASVPAAGETVTLRPTANLSTGGTATDVTDLLHPETAAIAARAAAIVGLDIAGVDLITPDIARPLGEAGGGIVEINAAPGLRMHLAPSHGRPRPVARAIVAHLFPPGGRGRVPIVAITGTNGKSTTARMVAHIAALGGARVGLATTGGIEIGGARVRAGDATGPRSARLVLADPTVDVAVLETARGGILREGLGFDRCDVGCVTNIAADHLGRGGLDTLGDLARAKSLVVRVVARRGLAVLNADDPLGPRMARRAGGRPAYFSLHGGAVMRRGLARFIEAGGTAVVREPGAGGGLLVLHARAVRTPLLPAAAIPATLGGLAEFNIANAAAAALCAHGLGHAPGRIAAALSTFDSSFARNPGRLNFANAGGARVLLDYAHNPAGIAALAAVVAGLRPHHPRALGLIAIPGDRRDDDILAVGRLAARHFDALWFREEPGRRGRPPGELAALLIKGALAEGFDRAAITVSPHERDAVIAVLAAVRPGELAVMTVTDVAACWTLVEAAAARPFREDG